MFSVMFDTQKKIWKKTRKKGKSRKTKIKTAQIGRSLKIIGAANSSVFCTSFLLVASCIYILQPVRFYIFFLYVSVPVMSWISMAGSNLYRRLSIFWKAFVTQALVVSYFVIKYLFTLVLFLVFYGVTISLSIFVCFIVMLTMWAQWLTICISTVVYVWLL